MKVIKHLFVILFTIFIANAVWAQSYSKQMTPIASEKLKNPIALSEVCSSVKIVEWRDSNHKATKLTDGNIKALKRYCKEAMETFPKFVKERGYKLRKGGKLKLSVCMMPVDSDPRNLNDIDYRFSARTKTYDEDGNVQRIWGYFHRNASHIYLRNTAANYHRVVFMHELFHAASYHYGVYDQHSGDKDKKDEVMARDFTAYLGYGR